MSLNIVIGTQWGDEGKGRITDLLAAESDIVARYNGGDNAGHKVRVGSQDFTFHLIPSGIVHPQVVCMLGIGMVINPVSLLEEVHTLSESGLTIGPRQLMVSHLAHLITPAHRYLDKVQEMARGKGSIGTTGRGIGPAYTDKVSRVGIRTLDILDLDLLREKVSQQIEKASQLGVTLVGEAPLDVKRLTDDYMEKALQLKPYLVDVGAALRQALREGKRVLAEGAQGTLLDVEYGTYPFVTSSSTLASGAFSGLGIGIVNPERVTGVAKAFQTRVGSGPFPTEITDEFAARLRGTGQNSWDEFGATTGRARRVGWHDGVLLRYVVEVNGLTELALTKLDILSGLPLVRVCVAYREKATGHAPTLLNVSNLDAYEAVYEELPGWEEPIQDAKCWEDLPSAAQQYVRKMEQVCGAPVKLISVGPERSQYFRVD